MRLEGKHVYIRESSFDDCKYFAEWEKKPEVTEFFTINATRDYEEVVREFIERLPDSTQVIILWDEFISAALTIIMILWILPESILQINP